MVQQKLLLKNKPKIIFYTASQSSPGKSFKNKKETYLSNYVGCKNFLEIIKKYKIESKFVNFSYPNFWPLFTISIQIEDLLMLI